MGHKENKVTKGFLLKKKKKLKRETTIFYTKKEREINNPSVCGCETPRRSVQLEFFHIFICENMVSFLYWFQWKNTFCEIMKVSILYLFVFLASKKQVTWAFAYSFFFLINLGFLPIGFTWNPHTLFFDFYGTMTA